MLFINSNETIAAVLYNIFKKLIYIILNIKKVAKINTFVEKTN